MQRLKILWSHTFEPLVLARDEVCAAHRRAVLRILYTSAGDIHSDTRMLTPPCPPDPDMSMSHSSGRQFARSVLPYDARLIGRGQHVCVGD